MKNPDLISTDDAMSFLDCNRMTLNRLTKKHKLKKEKISRTSYYLKSELRKFAGEVQENKKKTTKATSAKTTTPPTPTEMPPFLLTDDVQADFDGIVALVEVHTKDLFALDHLIESLLRIRHYKSFYHDQVEKDPSDMTYTKLLSQSLKDEISILKTLRIAP